MQLAIELRMVLTSHCLMRPGALVVGLVLVLVDSVVCIFVIVTTYNKIPWDRYCAGVCVIDQRTKPIKDCMEGINRPTGSLPHPKTMVKLLACADLASVLRCIACVQTGKLRTV